MTWALRGSNECPTYKSQETSYDYSVNKYTLPHVIPTLPASKNKSTFFCPCFQKSMSSVSNRTLRSLFGGLGNHVAEGSSLFFRILDKSILQSNSISVLLIQELSSGHASTADRKSCCKWQASKPVQFVDKGSQPVLSSLQSEDN